MPGVVHVSLSEVLEVQGGPLPENDLWAILCQATEALQDLFLRGEGIVFIMYTIKHLVEY